ncbi:hypothetical protein D0B54_01880 [Solimonas sp. K1W22B-7]|uniref:hypothetical protein n=1 Tax=Solimonas sp. K1W22B-7 TaxID=2303331 RepID=UPI000E331FC6|nr:hypothetical protein [Solimonas sp. K1W22B-7]AXQ27505.1 hypothetical protein D0B54_01880 [Solimonas sp. K1W22B-7]
MRSCSFAAPRAVIFISLALFGSLAAAGPIRSVGNMTFLDANTLAVADWRGGEIHALQLLPPAKAQSGPFNLGDISNPIARALNTQPDKLRFEDMAFRPGSNLAYIALSVEQKSSTPKPALVTVDSTGRVAVIDLNKAVRTSAALTDAPAAEKRLWRDIPEAAYTVTDMAYYEGKLYVAGLSNASFASTLRVYSYPFSGSGSATSVEMYHAVHNQTETRAPIRKMVIASLNGVPTLVAAYTCTPLVTIPLKDLKNGAHIVGKTIAELGWGSAPVDMVTFDVGQGPMVLLTNSHKSADLMPVSAIAEAALKPGLSTPIKWPNEPLLGLRSTSIPMSGLAQFGSQDKDFFAALRRDEATGAMELVSVRKGAFLRLSDFINEYDFAGFKYPPGEQWSGTHKTLRTDEGFSDLATLGK